MLQILLEKIFKKDAGSLEFCSFCAICLWNLQYND